MNSTHSVKKVSEMYESEFRHKLALYSDSASELMWTVKELSVVVLMLWLLIDHMFRTLSVSIPTEYPASPLLSSIRWSILIITILLFAINLLWTYAVRKARVKEVAKILSASHLYGQLVNQLQKEILRALQESTHENEQPTTS